MIFQNLFNTRISLPVRSKAWYILFLSNFDSSFLGSSKQTDTSQFLKSPGSIMGARPITRSAQTFCNTLVSCQLSICIEIIETFQITDILLLLSLYHIFVYMISMMPAIL